jgi:hypothetical protein
VSSPSNHATALLLLLLLAAITAARATTASSAPHPLLCCFCVEPPLLLTPRSLLSSSSSSTLRGITTLLLLLLLLSSAAANIGAIHCRRSCCADAGHCELRGQCMLLFHELHTVGSIVNREVQMQQQRVLARHFEPDAAAAAHQLDS